MSYFHSCMLSAHDETEAERLGALLEENALSLDLVSAFGGDRRMTQAEVDLLDDHRRERGERFYSDLLYTITHQYYPPQAAHDLWHEVLRHKYVMSAAMKRNIRIAVASLDYLTNLTGSLPSATLISEEQMAGIVRLSLLDGLTGLFNHTSCYQRLDTELRRSSRHNTVVTILMIDIDDFKKLNDEHGHQEGDRVLAALAAAIEGTARESDICCRYGGEEFAIILPSTTAAEATALAERLQERLRREPPNGRQLTVSVGAACSGPEAATSQALVACADKALYRAKAEGKNRIVLAQ
jgi:two-component system, cell cycle response regulator